MSELQVGEENSKELIPQENSKGDHLHNQCGGDHDLGVPFDLLMPT